MTMMFDTAFDRVFTNEGGFQNDYSDRGNWTSGVIGKGLLKGTKYGISAMTYPDLEIEQLSLEEAKEIYKRDWWDKLGMNDFHKALGYQMFDAAINHGMPNAVKCLQRAIEVQDDGFIGPVTKKAIREIDINDVLLRFLAERLNLMVVIRTWDRYGRGWAHRIAHNLILASKDN